MATPVVQASVEVDLVYEVESTLGVPQSNSGGGKKVRKVQSTLNPAVSAFQSNEFVSHQQILDLRHGMRSVGGTIEGELSLETYDDFLEALFRGSWEPGATTGFGSFAADHATSSFTRSAGSFIATGFKIGDIVRASGFSGGGVFNNNVNFRITALTALNMTVTPAPATIAGAAGVKLIVVGAKLLMGTEKRSFAIEQHYPAIDSSELFKGCRIVAGSLNVPPNGMATASFTVFGLDTETLSSTAAPFYTEPEEETTTNLLAGPTGVVRIAGADTLVATSWSAQLAGNFSNQPTIGGAVAPDVFAGRLVATGSFSAYMDSADYADALLNETEIDIQMILDGVDTTPGGFISLLAQRVKLMGVQKMVTPNGGIIATYNWQALRKEGGDGTAYDTSTLVVQRSNPLGNWPWPDSETISDFEWTTASPLLWSGSLGQISIAQAFTTQRATNNDLAFNGRGKLVKFPANTPRITEDRGMWGETSGTCGLDFNGDLANAAWVKSANVSIVKDLESPFEDGSVPGCRILVNVDGDATCLQTRIPMASGESMPHAMFYWPVGVVFHGPVEITQDGLVVVTDIRPWLIEGQWVQIGGVSQPVTLANNVVGCRLKDALAGDSIGMMLANIERGYVMTTPIYTPGTASVSRASDVTTQNMANFPPLWNLQKFTLFVVCRPGAIPLPAFGDTDHPRAGWTVVEINNPYEIIFNGRGGIAPEVGNDDYGILTVTTYTNGSLADGTRFVIGTGVQSRTDVVTQLTTTEPDLALGKRGTYRVFSDLGQQTTGVNIVVSARLKNAQGYGLNAALKPNDPIRPGAQRIGLTVTAEPDMTDFGNDPQNKDYSYNKVNAEAFSVNVIVLRGVVALDGDTELLHPDQFTVGPVLNSGIVVNWGCQYPSGGPLDGDMQRGILVGREYSDEEAAAATILLQKKYRHLNQPNVQYA